MFGVTVTVPVPSGATTNTCGEPVARAVSVPPADDFCWVVNVFVPPVDGALAPGPPDAVDPYVIVQVAPLARLKPGAWIVFPAGATVPPLHVVVVKPALVPVVDGADQPAGAAIVSVPPVIV